MPERIMLDTNVVIDYLRELPEAVMYVQGMISIPTFSSVVVGELYAGVRDGQERRRLNGLVQQSEVVPVNQEIAMQGGLYCRQYRASHGIRLPDALIAATAIVRGAGLITRDIKHFPMLANVLSPY